MHLVKSRSSVCYLCIFYSFFMLFCIPNAYAWNWPWNNDCSDDECVTPERYFNRVYIGPEIYHACRTREGGTHQSGTVYGARCGYDYVKRFNFYVGGEALYGKGHLTGHSTKTKKIKSAFTDLMIEGRAGYTFQQKTGYRFSLTPFVGGGYAVEKNNFIHPTPLHVHFRTQYSYALAGFLSQMSWSPSLDIGINFKARYMIDAKNRVTHDPDFDNFDMLIKNEWHYRVELPITYYVNPKFLLALVPFYEYRHYGGQPNYPFDFLETKLCLYGATLRFVGCF